MQLQFFVDTLRFFAGISNVTRISRWLRDAVYAAI